MNAQWLGDILLGNLEALRQIQYSRYTAFSLQDPFAPTQHLVTNLLGEWRPPAPTYTWARLWRSSPSLFPSHTPLPAVQAFVGLGDHT